MYFTRFDTYDTTLLREGIEDGQPTSSTQAMNAQAAQSASSAKVKTLPALQANQDPFGAPEAFGGMGCANI